MIQGDPGRRSSSVGDDCTLYPTECLALHGRPPPHFSSLTFPASSLPAFEKMSAVAEKCGLLCGLPLAPGPPSSVCWAPLLQQRSHCSGGCWFFPHLPLGEERFPNAGMERKQKVVDSATPAALVEERTIPEVHFPAPHPSLQTHKFPLDDQVLPYPIFL